MSQVITDQFGSYIQKPYVPRGACKQLFYCTDRLVLLEGPAGTGKSRGALEKIKYLAMKFPNSRHLMVRKTRASMTESVLATWENHVIPQSMISGNARRGHRDKYEFPDNVEIVLGGMDNPDRIMSTEWDTVYFGEAGESTKEDIEKLNSRLRNNRMPYHQFILDCNPGPPQHHLNVSANKGDMTRLKSVHQDNPTLFHDDGTPTELGREYMLALSRLTGARRQRLYMGNWAAADNLVYESFDPDIHIIDEHDVPYSHFLVSVDWGWLDPGVMQVWGIDLIGRSVLEYETYRTKKDMDWWKQIAKNMNRKYAPKRWICDSAAPDKISQLRYLGLSAMKAKKDITLGIQVVQARLVPHEDGKPMILFKRNAREVLDDELKESGKPTQTTEEFWSYTFDEPKEDRNYKEVPVDFNNHGMDCTRYLSVYLDKFRTLDIVRLDKVIMM